jgi:hypothetical protein
LLGLHRDDRVAALTGRSKSAVQLKREKLGLPNPSSPGWTAEELALLGTATDAEVAPRTGRTEGAVTLKRCKLGIPTFCDRRVHSSRPMTSGHGGARTVGTTARNWYRLTAVAVRCQVMLSLYPAMF